MIRFLGNDRQQTNLFFLPQVEERFAVLWRTEKQPRLNHLLHLFEWPETEY